MHSKSLKRFTRIMSIFIISGIIVSLFNIMSFENWLGIIGLTLLTYNFLTNNSLSSTIEGRKRPPMTDNPEMRMDFLNESTKVEETNLKDSGTWAPDNNTRFTIENLLGISSKEVLILSTTCLLISMIIYYFHYF